jgi:AcrR family transcriptional regulator
MQADLSTRLNRGAIVAAAAKVFARLGFAATRVEDLLEASGIARRTFYKYFDSKEDVLSALYDVATGELLQALQSMPRSQAPIDLLRSGLDMYLDYFVENAALIKVLVEQAIRSDSPLADSRRRFRADVAQFMALASGAAGKERDPMVYSALISALEGLSLDLLASGAGPDELKRAKRVMRFILARVLAPDS